MNFTEAMKAAAALPETAETPIYQPFETPKTDFWPVYDDSPVHIFEHFHRFSRNKWIRENGQYYEYRVFGQELRRRRKYSRVFMNVSGVTFDIVGLKRRSSKLPAGVLINNVTFF